VNYRLNRIVGESSPKFAQSFFVVLEGDLNAYSLCFVQDFA
jgi:hypothetical protein